MRPPPHVADPTDAPPRPFVAPEGWRIVDEPPPAAALVHGSAEHGELVGRSLLCNFDGFGWQPGTIVTAVTAGGREDRRHKIYTNNDRSSFEYANFIAQYEMDDDGQTVSHALKLEEYGDAPSGGDPLDRWVLLLPLRESELSELNDSDDDDDGGGGGGAAAAAAN